MRNHRNEPAAIFFRRYECPFQGPVRSDEPVKERAGKKRRSIEEEEVGEVGGERGSRNEMKKGVKERGSCWPN